MISQSAMEREREKKQNTHSACFDRLDGHPADDCIIPIVSSTMFNRRTDSAWPTAVYQSALAYDGWMPSIYYGISNFYAVYKSDGNEMNNVADEENSKRRRYQQQPLAHLLGQRIDLRKFTAHSHPRP